MGVFPLDEQMGLLIDPRRILQGPITYLTLAVSIVGNFALLSMHCLTAGLPRCVLALSTLFSGFFGSFVLNLWKRQHLEF